MFGSKCRPLAEVLGASVLKQPHLLGQEVMEKSDPRLLPLVQPVQPVSHLCDQFLRQVVQPQLSLCSKGEVREYKEEDGKKREIKFRRGSSAEKKCKMIIGKKTSQILRPLTKRRRRYSVLCCF